MPHTARDSDASGVSSRLRNRINSASPGASRSITARVASGVLSRGANPVPPVVRIKFTSPRSAYSLSLAEIKSRSSDRISETATRAPSFSSSVTTAGPDRSSRSPREAESLIVNTAATISTLAIGPFPWKSSGKHGVVLQRFATFVNCAGFQNESSRRELQPLTSGKLDYGLWSVDRTGGLQVAAH
jgi:hypothetical protein